MGRYFDISVYDTSADHSEQRQEMENGEQESADDRTRDMVPRQ
jgi:hypothetical protein